MAEQAQLQEILGVDKKNPFFTLCSNSEQPGKLLVYFGMSLLEVIDDDPNSPSFKLLLGRLYNAGVQPRSLLGSFKIAYTSLRRWADALKCGDSEKLISVLAGRQHPRKLTTEILSFSQARFFAIYPENHYSYSKVIRQEILATFAVSISGESLRPYFATWLNRLTANTAVTDNSIQAGIDIQPVHNNLSINDDVDVENLSTDVKIINKCHKTQESAKFVAKRPANEQETEASICTTAQEENSHESGQEFSKVPSHMALEENNRKHAVVLAEPQVMTLPNGGYQFCHHAGLLLFSGFLDELSEAISTGGQLIKQWLAAILLGAINIEQTKLLNYPSLECCLGETLANRHKQRQNLKEIAQTPCVDELHRLNGQWVGINHCSDFYYDPHSKHYTGTNKLLKGWCSRLRFAEKVLHMDFIHMPTGEPVYLSHDDNYQDLRERFFDVVSRFRQLFGFPSSTALTFVLDRGIYGIDTFEKFLTDKNKNHFITWEKGFRADLHKDIDWQESISLYRAKNSSKDLKRYHFSYCSERWSRNNKIRRILVKATNPKGRSITVSVLCSDLSRCTKEIITLMFDRWIQENDFKYLDVHFGINEITSYATLSYKEMDTHLQDKQVKSGFYKALEKQRVQLKSRLKTQLLNEHRAKNKNKERLKKIAELTQQLKALEEKIAQTEKEVSRLQALAEAGFKKLDTAKKSVMDGVKILARNMFYELLRPFKNAYDNYRDDHMLLRHLTRSPGLIRDTGGVIEVLLIPQACLPPKVINIFNSMLDTFNCSQRCMPDGSGHKITIHLLQNNKELIEMSPELQKEEKPKQSSSTIALGDEHTRRRIQDTGTLL